MYNNSSNYNASVNNSPVGLTNAPPESLAARALNLNGELDDLNSRLSELRHRMFGECEPSAGSTGPKEAPPLQLCIEAAQQQAREASAQVSSILNRL